MRKHDFGPTPVRFRDALTRFVLLGFCCLAALGTPFFDSGPSLPAAVGATPSLKAAAVIPPPTAFLKSEFTRLQPLVPVKSAPPEVTPSLGSGRWGRWRQPEWIEPRPNPLGASDPERAPPPSGRFS